MSLILPSKYLLHYTQCNTNKMQCVKQKFEHNTDLYLPSGPVYPEAVQWLEYSLEWTITSWSVEGAR